MALRLSLLSLALLSAVAAAGPVPRIIDGEAAAIDAWPAMAHLVFNSSRPTRYDHHCGAVHIGDGVVVTAAHCVRDQQLRVQQVCVGNALSANRNACYNVTDYEWIDEAPVGGTGDLAVLRLSTSLSKAARWPAADIANPDMDASLSEGEVVTAVGFGSTIFATYTPPDALKQAQLSVMSTELCRSLLSLTLWGDDMLCINRINGGAAPGDSGSPVFMWRDNKPFAIAAASVSSGTQAGYARYGAHHEWMAAVLNQWQQQAASRELHLMLPADAVMASTTLRLHNWSTSPRDLEIGELPDSHPFELDASDCLPAPALGSCQLKVTASRTDNLPLAAAIEVALSFVGDTPKPLKLSVNEALPLTVGASPEGIRWSQHGGWLSDDSGIHVTLDEGQQEAVLLAEVEGPGTLQLTVNSSTSGDDLFTLTVDGKTLHLANGICNDHTFSIAIDNGPQRLDWRLTLSDDSQNTEARITSILWASTVAATAEQLCSRPQPVAVDGGSSGGSGGGGIALPTLLTLIGLTLWRRRTILV